MTVSPLITWKRCWKNCADFCSLIARSSGPAINDTGSALALVLCCRKSLCGKSFRPQFAVDWNRAFAHRLWVAGKTSTSAIHDVLLFLLRPYRAAIKFEEGSMLLQRTAERSSHQPELNAFSAMPITQWTLVEAYDAFKEY